MIITVILGYKNLYQIFTDNKFSKIYISFHSKL